MSRRETRKAGKAREVAALEAHGAWARAEADAHFDERALETQRQRILTRVALAGTAARVIRFPVTPSGPRPSTGVNGRWISVAAAAGLIIGLAGGQWLRVVPGSRATDRPTSLATGTAPSSHYVSVMATVDDGLLAEVDMAVQLRSALELRALDEFTPVHEPR